MSQHLPQQFVLLVSKLLVILSIHIFRHKDLVLFDHACYAACHASDGSTDSVMPIVTHALVSCRHTGAPGNPLTGLPLSCWHRLIVAGFHGSSPLLWAAVIQKAHIPFHVSLHTGDNLCLLSS